VGIKFIIDMGCITITSLIFAFKGPGLDTIMLISFIGGVGVFNIGAWTLQSSL